MTPGDELLGLAAVLLALGARTVVASVLLVPDAATRTLMVEFHRRLMADAGPVVALARAQAAMVGSPGDTEPVAAFTCFGAG